MIRPPEPEDLKAFSERIFRLFEDLEITYAICGSFAAMEYSEPRLSIDVDMMVITKPAKLVAFVTAVEAWGVYVPPVEVLVEQIIPQGQPFNVIDGASGSKVDIYPATNSGLHQSAMRRRRDRTWDIHTGQTAWFLAPEDVILFKLEFYQRGGEVSQKHPADIAKILKVSAEDMDFDYLEDWAGRIGVLDLWHRVRASTDQK